MRLKNLFLFFLALIYIVHGKISAELSDRNREKAKSLHLENILLVINYNHPYYDSIPFLKEVYSPVFPHIVFYGEKKDPAVIKIDHHYGWWGQNVLSDAMRRFPGYEGYICVQDDCWMNFWNFERLDRNKIWFSPGIWQVSIHNPLIDWNWWNQSFGRQSVIHALGKLPPSNRNILEQNMGKDVVGYTFSDFVYVPGRLREAYISICDCFASPVTFVELAIPNILLSIDSKYNMEKLNIYWAGSGDAKQMYDKGYDWIHPIKFSSISNREFIKKMIEEWYLQE